MPLSKMGWLSTQDEPRQTYLKFCQLYPQAGLQAIIYPLTPASRLRQTYMKGLYSQMILKTISGELALRDKQVQFLARAYGQEMANIAREQQSNDMPSGRLPVLAQIVILQYLKVIAGDRLQELFIVNFTQSFKQAPISIPKKPETGWPLQLEYSALTEMNTAAFQQYYAHRLDCLSTINGFWHRLLNDPIAADMLARNLAAADVMADLRANANHLAPMSVVVDELCDEIAIALDYSMYISDNKSEQLNALFDYFLRDYIKKYQYFSGVYHIKSMWSYLMLEKIEIKQVSSVGMNLARLEGAELLRMRERVDLRTNLNKLAGDELARTWGKVYGGMLTRLEKGKLIYLKETGLLDCVIDGLYQSIGRVAPTSQDRAFFKEACTKAYEYNFGIVPEQAMNGIGQRVWIKKVFNLAQKLAKRALMVYGPLLTLYGLPATIVEVRQYIQKNLHKYVHGIEETDLFERYCLYFYALEAYEQHYANCVYALALADPRVFHDVRPDGYCHIYERLMYEAAEEVPDAQSLQGWRTNLNCIQAQYVYMGRDKICRRLGEDLARSDAMWDMVGSPEQMLPWMGSIEQVRESLEVVMAWFLQPVSLFDYTTAEIEACLQNYVLTYNQLIERHNAGLATAQARVQKLPPTVNPESMDYARWLNEAQDLTYDNVLQSSNPVLHAFRRNSSSKGQGTILSFNLDQLQLK